MIDLETFVENGIAAQAAVDEKCRPLLKTPLINREHVRSFLLEHARKTRAQPFIRVSEDTLIQANETLRQWLIKHVRQFPSRGRTL